VEISGFKVVGDVVEYGGMIIQSSTRELTDFAIEGLEVERGAALVVGEGSRVNIRHSTVAGNASLHPNWNLPIGAVDLSDSSATLSHMVAAIKCAPQCPGPEDPPGNDSFPCHFLIQTG